MNIFIRRMALAGLAAVAWLGISSSALADTVFLNDGREVEGTVIEDDANTVSIRLASGATRSFRRSDVDTVVYDRTRPAPARPADAVPDVTPDKPADGGETKTVEGGQDGKESGAKKEEKKGDTAEEKDDWTPPPGLPGFPDHAKRMSADKEAAFMAALDKLASGDETQRSAGRTALLGLGTDALPYCVAGIQHVNVSARTACMTLIGQANGRSAIKQVIEIFYAAMPDEGRAATWQVPFIRATIDTLKAITGQAFISVEAKSEMVQQGLKQYIDWYKANYDRLPPQLGEKKIDPTDPEYGTKLKKERELKLAKRSWPRPELPSDMVNGPNPNGPPDRPAIPPGGGERQADRDYLKSYDKVDRDYLKRPGDR